ncbi:hypothetical protein J0910_03690 [Nocardiopsis sp. CNT-189]|uniref:hypothetical protein n=1 Tax=Nocardiopsis oceanisediminis TaxID=2816862 RepID=UPI003B2A456F
MSSLRHRPGPAPAPGDARPPITGTVVLTCPLHRDTPRRRSGPDYFISGFDGATAPAPPRHPTRGDLPPAALAGAHVVLDIGDAPGFFDAGWDAPITARLVRAAASVEVRGNDPVGVARVRAALADALARTEDEDGAPAAVRP